jgi:Fur family transcriptional regulator, ferric uptake regulator
MRYAVAMARGSGTTDAHERAKATAELRAAGLRATSQRIDVVVALARLDGDVTAQSLHEELRRGGSGLGLATVYRALAALADAGIIDAMQHGHGTCWRKCAPGHHHHLTCERCHAVVEVRDCEVGEWAGRVAASHGFSDVRHVVELRGTCERCRAA